MEQPQIKYRYALDGEGEIADALALTPADRADFICIGCSGTLRPVIPECRQKHFRHKVARECSPETYLHRMAKRVFKQEYQGCIDSGNPYILQLNQNLVCKGCSVAGPCDMGYEVIDYDLTKKFKIIKEEERDGQFVPDLLLLGDSGEKIYIEIAVTHSVSENKITSGNRIIEADIASEIDLDILKNRLLSCDTGFTFYNFKKITKEGSYKESCTKKINAFVLYKSGKAWVGYLTAAEFESRQNSPHVARVTTMSLTHREYLAEQFVELLEESYRSGMVVKNCYLCRYHAGSKKRWYDHDDPRAQEKGGIFCKTYKKQCMSNHAAECDRYRPDEKVFGQPRHESYYKR